MAKVTGNARNKGGDGQRWSLAFDGGDGWQQQRWQGRIKIALNGGDNGQRQGGGEQRCSGQTRTAVAAAAMVTGQRQ